MKRSMAVVLVGFCLIGLVVAGDDLGGKAPTFSDEAYGFSIEAPVFATPPQGGQVTRLIVLGPAEDGFAANVNVVVQHVSTSRDQLRAASLQQFQALGLSVGSHRDTTIAGRDAVIFDSHGIQQGRNLRFLSAAVIDTHRVFVITCTAPTESFERHQEAFQRSIASFKLTGS